MKDPETEAIVYLLDDDPALREAMRRLLKFSGLPTKTFRSGHDFLAYYRVSEPGCLVSDVRLPDINGLEVLRALAAEGLSIPVIMITGYGDVPTAVNAMTAGAFDFIEKPFTDEILLRSVRRAIEFDAGNRRKEPTATMFRARRARLTPREREVMDRVVAGHQNKEIARLLGLSPRTVEKYRSFVMAKMRARNLPDLVQMAVEAKAIGRRNGGASRPSV